MKLEECPVRDALDVIGGKWKPVITFQLLAGAMRFGELRRCIPDATQKMLTQQLRELERDGIVAREVFPEVPPKVEYSLTEYGQTLRPVMTELCHWGKQHRARAVSGGKPKFEGRKNRENLNPKTGYSGSNKTNASL